MRRVTNVILTLLVTMLMTCLMTPMHALGEEMELSPQATITATYLNKGGGTSSRNDVKQLSSSMSLLEGGWWIVDKDMTISHRLDIKDDTNLILKDGVTLTANQGISIRSASTLTIYAQSASKGTAGKLIASSDSYSALGGNPKFSGGGLVINGGVIRAEGGFKSAGIGGSDEGNITFLEVNGGFIEAYGWNKDVGGKPSYNAGAGIGGGYHGDGFPVIINGGTVYAKGGFGSAGIGGGQGNGGYGCTINGGTVTAIGGERGAGIGGGNNGRSQGVTITGGTVTAEGGERAAGIGGGYDSYSDGITIAGGTVTATGGVYGAGIGGGMDGESTQIWISGGTVVAKAKSPRMGWGTGAAIGGGFGGDFSSEMIVSGGDVTAIGARGGAGIGAGAKANMTGSLKVTGGIVRAYGGASAQKDVDQNANRGAAGIGGGEEIDTNTGGEGGSVRIEGGTVIACGGGSWRCAIGHGHNDSVMGTISIADDMWTRWTNTVTLGAQQNDYTFTAPTVRDADLSRSWTDRRVYDSQYMRYVIIEKCPHPSTTGLYTDISTTEHEINFKCEYCKAPAGTIQEHDFSNNHTCICGHMEHAVTFYDEDGKVYVKTDYYPAGTSIKKPDQDPKKDGYTFLGWFRKVGDQLAKRPYSFYIPVSGDMALYAQFKKDVIERTVKFYDDDDKLLQTQKVEDGQKATRPADPASREGWTFLGWFEKNGDRYAESPFNFGTEIKKDYSLYQKWELDSSKPTFTVTFNSNGGSEIPQQQVAKGGRIKTKGIIPTNNDPNKIFTYWYSDAETRPYDFSTTVESDLTLTARWVERDTTAQIYRVTLDLNGGVPAPNTKTYLEVTANATATKPADPTRAGWRFDGWQLDGKAYDWGAAVTKDITLVAAWTQVCTVTFTSEDSPSGMPEPQTVDAGQKATEPKDPTRAGYRLEDWLLDGWPYDFDDPVTSDITLEAHWVQVHTVHFELNGGTGVEDQPVDDGDYLSLQGLVPTRGAGESEWLFAGWFTDRKCSKPYNPAPVKADLTLYAKWVERDTTVDFKVTFNPNGGRLASYDDGVQVVKQGEKAVAPAQPTLEGAAFGGWKLNGVDYNWNDPVNEDITLVAAWEQWVTVSFDAAGGSAVESQRLLAGATATKPADPVRPGYLFEGWFFDEADDPDPWNFDEYQILDSLTLTAHWKADTRTVSFDSAGGSEVEPQEVASGAKATRPADPTREGWRFAGWYLGSTSYGFDTPVTADITLTARWLRICTVRYDSNGGTPVRPLQVVSGTKLTRPADPVREGYSFLGWVVDALDGTTPDWDFDDAVEDDLVLHAHWLAETRIHTVTFDSQGGSAIESQKVNHGDRVSRKDIVPTRGAGVSEWLFAGWYTNPECTVYYNFEKRVTADLTLFAKWVKRELPSPEPTPTPGPDTPEPGPAPTPGEELVAVLFDSDGGSPVDPQVLRKGGYATVPEEPVRDGHSFEGWSLRDGNGNVSEEPFIFEETPVTEDIWLVATWSLDWYTISFDLNYEGAPEPPESQDVDYDDFVQQPPDPTREGYLFAGWYQKDENGVLFSNPYAFDTPVDQEMTLYADWVPISESGADLLLVVFESLGGTDVDPQLVESGMRATRPDDPTREGYNFGGWFTDPDGTTAYDFATAVTADLTLYAIWEAVDVPVPAPTPGTITGVVSLAEGSWDVKSDNIDKVAQGVPADDEGAAIQAGANATLTLTVSSIGQVGDEDRQAAASLLADLGATEGSWNDLTLTLSVEGLPDRTVTEVGTPIKLSVTVPDGLHADGRTFWLIRCHDGEAKAVATGTEGVLEAESDLFSSWLIAYRDEDVPVPAPGTITGVVSLAEGAWDVRSDNIGEVAQVVPTDGERSAVEAGKDAELTLTASPLPDPPAADREAAAELLGRLGAVEGSWNDLSLAFAVGGGAERAVARTPEAVKLTVAVPESLRADGRAFWLVRCHGGEAAVVATGTGEALEAESDLFSSWLLAYRDADAPVPTPDPRPTPTPTPNLTPAVTPRPQLPRTADEASAGLAPLACLGAVALAVGLLRRRKDA